MKSVSQVLPKEQVEILVESLCLLKSVLENLKTNSNTIQYKVFDIQVLKGLLNQSDVVINIPFDLYENFTARNGVDFPNF